MNPVGQLRLPWSRTDGCIVTLLLVLTAAPYLQVATFDFVSFDDPEYITNSPLVQQGLDPAALWEALGVYQDNWHPLTWWSLMLDVQLFGLNPRAMHIENLAWHLSNVLLLFIAMRALSGDRWRSAMVAAVFGIHPLHVESVAWLTERKDVLSGFWWMLGLWGYSRYAMSGSRRSWQFVTLMLLLGLLSKQIVVTLPCVFLLLDFWPLGRWRDPRTGLVTLAQCRRLFAEKLLWFVLIACACGMTIHAQKSAAEAAADWPLSMRLTNATFSAVRYLQKSFWPTRLSVQYPLNPPESLVPILTSAGILLTITAVAIAIACRSPASRNVPGFDGRAVLVGWLWYLGVLVPVIGIVQVGTQAMADRYMYLPQIGLAIAVAWLVPDPTSRVSARVYLGTATLVISGLMACCAQQVAVWRNSETLYSHALRVDPTNDLALLQIGWHNLLQGNAAAGLAQLHASIAYDRQRWEARRGLFGTPSRKQEIAIRRRWAQTYFTLAQVEVREKLTAAAVSDFREALSLDPGLHEARLALGMTLLNDDQPAAALHEFEELLRVEPRNSQAIAGRDRAQSRIEVP